MSDGPVIKWFMRPIIWLLDTVAWPFAVIMELAIRLILRVIKHFNK